MADKPENPNGAQTLAKVDIANLSAQRSDVFFINLKDKAELYNAYMPYIPNGALFVRTEKDYSISDEVYLLVNLLEEPEKYPVAGKVVWITPRCAQGGRAAGIGVQFTNEEAKELRNRIEGYLAGMLQSEKVTDTI